MLAIGCALPALAVGALLAPTLAAGQADEEYNLQLPGAGGDNDATQSGSGGGASGTSESTPPATEQPVAPPTESSGSVTEATGNAAGQSGGGSGGKDNANAQGSGGGGAPVTSTGTELPTVSGDSSDDGGGAPILLILLGAGAAVCTGMAAWRLRNREPAEPRPSDQAPPRKVGTGAASATGEPQ